MRKLILLSTFLALSVGSLSSAQERLPGFGREGPEKRRLPGFGVDVTPYPLVESDRSSARSAIGKVDTNRDGIMSREELKNSRYSKYESRRFAFDANRDNQLTVEELASYYAKLRLDKAAKKKQAAAKPKSVENQIILSSNSGRFVRGSVPPGVIVFSNPGAQANAQQIKQLQQMQFIVKQHNGFVMLGMPTGSPLAAQEVLRHFDKNSDGVLDRDECRRIDNDLASFDRNNDRLLDQGELTTWLAKRSMTWLTTPGTDLISARDKDGDGQVSMAEYSDSWTEAKLAEFAHLDRNRDGFITAAEAKPAKTKGGREFKSASSQVIEAGLGAASEIEIEDDFVIADVNVRLSIFHGSASQLDAILVSPSGRQVQLFSGQVKKWKGGNFEKTVFDDQAPKSLAEANPPFRGSFQPAGAQSGENSKLASYDGERSRGVWRLIIRAERSLKAGLLDSWAIELTPRP